MELIKEAQYLTKLGLDIPETATTLLRQEEQIRQISVNLQELLNEIKRKDHRTQHFVKDKQDTVNLV